MEGPDGYSETRGIDSIVDRRGNNVNERERKKSEGREVRKDDKRRKRDPCWCT